jgi:hypothetical protein
MDIFRWYTELIVIFIFVLVRFPTFLRHVKAEGAAPNVVVRLTTFYELNVRSPPSIPIHLNSNIGRKKSSSELYFDSSPPRRCLFSQ